MKVERLNRLAWPLAAFAVVQIPAAAMAAEPMPQLDFGNPLLLGQIFWGAVIFVALYFLLSRWALPQVETVLQHRAQRIAGDLDAARAAKAKADDAVQALTETTRKARAEAQAAIAAALERAKAEAGAQAREANARVDAQVQAAEASIAEAKTAAMQALHQVAAETTIAMIGRLTGLSPDRQAIDRAVDASLSARGQA